MKNVIRSRKHRGRRTRRTAIFRYGRSDPCAQKVIAPASRWNVHVLGRSVAPCRARCAPTTRSIGRTVHGHLVMQVLVRSCRAVLSGGERATTPGGIPREKLQRAAVVHRSSRLGVHCAPPVTYSRLERRYCCWPVVPAATARACRMRLRRGRGPPSRPARRHLQQGGPTAAAGRPLLHPDSAFSDR